MLDYDGCEFGKGGPLPLLVNPLCILAPSRLSGSKRLSSNLNHEDAKALRYTKYNVRI